MPDQAQQGGDQFLDGIGETGLVARYVLNGNVEDSSRNQFHATMRGTGGTFVEDPQPRRVLLLTGDGSHLELPAQTFDIERADLVRYAVQNDLDLRGSSLRMDGARSFG